MEANQFEVNILINKFALIYFDFQIHLSFRQHFQLPL